MFFKQFILRLSSRNFPFIFFCYNKSIRRRKMILNYCGVRGQKAVDFLADVLGDSVLSLGEARERGIRKLFSANAYILTVPLYGGLSCTVLDDIKSTVFCGSKILYILFMTPSESAARSAAEKIISTADFVLFGYESINPNKTGGVTAAEYVRLRQFSEYVRCYRPLNAKKDFLFPIRFLQAKPVPFS